MTLEDETGNINIVLWRGIQECFRQAILSGHILYIKGKLEYQQGVTNIIAGYIEKHDHASSDLKSHSRNFHWYDFSLPDTPHKGVLRSIHIKAPGIAAQGLF